MRLIQSSEEGGGDYIAGSPLFFYIVVTMIKKVQSSLVIQTLNWVIHTTITAKVPNSFLKV